jgi:hypothetical protein
MLTAQSLTCRLPQTPRTPTAAAAHYFDDIFTHKGKAKKPNHLRRSSTSRSIGLRSDWEATDDDDTYTPINRTNSIGYLNEEALKQKTQMDHHVAHYVSDQLERLRTHRDSDDFDCGEFETSVDGTSERGNGYHNGDDDYFTFGKGASRNA